MRYPPPESLILSVRFRLNSPLPCRHIGSSAQSAQQPSWAGLPASYAPGSARGCRWDSVSATAHKIPLIIKKLAGNFMRRSLHSLAHSPFRTKVSMRVSTPRHGNSNVAASLCQGRPNKSLEVTRLSGHGARLRHLDIFSGRDSRGAASLS